MNRTKESFEQAYIDGIKAVNDSLAQGAYSEVENNLATLKQVEGDLRKLIEKEVFNECKTTHEAILRRSFIAPSHKSINEEGKLVRIEKADKEVMIDLKAFCEHHGFPLEWWYELQALNKRLTVKVARSLGVGPTELRKINDSYTMNELAKQIELGQNPDSNSQVTKHMQKVLDLLDEGCGRVNGYDLAYVMSTYTKRNSKRALSVSCSKHSALQNILLDVFHRVATGKVYDVDYKRTDPASTSEPAKEEAKKTSSKKVTTVKKPSAKKSSEAAA